MLVDLINYLLYHESSISSHKKTRVEENENQLYVDLILELEYGVIIPNYISKFRGALKSHLENNTGINVKEINIEVYSLSVED